MMQKHDALDCIAEAFRALDDDNLSHDELLDAVAFVLTTLGFRCKREEVVLMPERNGRLDLVARIDDMAFAIELDRNTPRKKSIRKIEHFNAEYDDTGSMIVLRQKCIHPRWTWTSGVVTRTLMLQR